MEHFPVRTENVSIVELAERLKPPGSFAIGGNPYLCNDDGPSLMMDDSNACIILLDLNGRVRRINSKAMDALELTSDAAFVDQPWDALWPADMRSRVTAALQAALAGVPGRFTGYNPTARGAERWWDVVVSRQAGGAGEEPLLAVGFTDATERRQATRKLRWLTTHDNVTGLPNRRLFGELFHQLMESSESDGRSLAMAMFSIDGLKQVNKAFGTALGDDLLRIFAGRLNGIPGDRNIAARMGGDEFAVALVGLPHVGNLAELVSSRLLRVCAPFRHQGQKLDCSVRVGISLFPDDGKSAADLLRYSDAALEVAKSDGPDHIQFFNSDIRQSLQRQPSAADLAGNALADEWSHPRYRPKVDLRTRQIIGYEALQGWNIPAGSLLSPELLTTAFKGPDISALLSDLMLDKIIVSLRQGEGRENMLPVAINLTADHIRRPEFADRLLNRVASVALPPASIEIEVAEEAFTGNDAAAVAPILRRLSEAGFKIVLDGFGRGSAALQQLRHFPIHMVKIDPSIIRNITSDAGDLALVEAIVAWASRLSVDVIADGIETTEQAELAYGIGCASGQGPLFDTSGMPQASSLS